MREIIERRVVKKQSDRFFLIIIRWEAKRWTFWNY